MTLGAILTFIGLLLTSYSVARADRRIILLTFVPPIVVIAPVLISAVFLAYPLILDLQGISFSRADEAVAQLMAFLVLVLGFAYPLWAVLSARLGRLTARRFSRLLRSALIERDWQGLRYIVRANRGKLINLLDEEALELLFDPAFVRAMVEIGDWLHLELLAEKDAWTANVRWKFIAANALGRAMLDGDATLIQKAPVRTHGGHEYVNVTEEEEALLDRTYRSPKWYIAVRADYGILLRAIERLESGEYDARYNAASNLYSKGQGITARWNCPIWVAAKTIETAIKKAIDVGENGDMYVSDLLDLLRSVVERSNYTAAAWNHPGADSSYPTPFSYLTHRICGDLEGLAREAIVRALLQPAGTLSAKSAPQFPVIASIWAWCLHAAAREQRAGTTAFRRNLIQNYLNTMLQIGFTPFDIDSRVQKTPEPVRVTYRDELCESLLNAFRWDKDAKAILEEATERLDRGKFWVSDGLDWLRARIAGGRQGGLAGP